MAGAPFFGLELYRPGDSHLYSPADPELLLLQVQVTEIIRSVLDAGDPDKEDVRARLRAHLARNPGHPELALLAHLQERHTASRP